MPPKRGRRKIGKRGLSGLSPECRAGETLSVSNVAAAQLHAKTTSKPDTRASYSLPSSPGSKQCCVWTTCAAFIPAVVWGGSVAAAAPWHVDRRFSDAWARGSREPFALLHGHAGMQLPRTLSHWFLPALCATSAVVCACLCRRGGRGDDSDCGGNRRSAASADLPLREAERSNGKEKLSTTQQFHWYWGALAGTSYHANKRGIADGSPNGWLTELLHKFWPSINRLMKQIVEGMEPALQAAVPSVLRRIRFTNVDLGDSSPVCKPNRVLPHDFKGEDGIQIQMPIVWDSSDGTRPLDIALDLGVAGLHLGIKRIEIACNVVVVLAPLLREVSFHWQLALRCVGK